MAPSEGPSDTPGPWPFFFFLNNFIREAETATPRGKELQIIDSMKTFQEK